MLRRKWLGVGLGLGGLMSAVLVGTSALPANASSDYTICNQENQCVVLSGTESFTAVYPEKWEWDGGDRDVAGQEAVGTSWCLTPLGGTGGDGLTSTVCNGAPRQEWWLDPSTGLLINEYWSVKDGTNLFLCANTSGALYVRTGYYNGYCVWTL
jgi:hypothetical protein